MNKRNIKKEINDAKQIINVTEYGADSSGKVDSTTAIWDAFEKARSIDGQVIIDFPKGTYLLHKDKAQNREIHLSNTDSIQYPEKKIALLLEDQKDIILNGNGSLFLIGGDVMALGILQSSNIVLYDFSWDYITPTVIEMEIIDIGVEKNQQYTDFKIPACFSYSIKDNTDFNWYGDINPSSNKPYWISKNHDQLVTLVGYHPDKKIVRRYPPQTGPFINERTAIKQLSNGHIRVYYGNSRPKEHQVGLVFEFCNTPDRESSGAFIWESSDVYIEKVNVHYLHSFGWLTQMSKNVSYYNCNFESRELSERNVTGFADLIHVSGAAGHIHIEDCNFAHSFDDPINIHGTFTRVEEKLDNYTLVLKYVHRQQGGFPQYYKGDKVTFYRRDTLLNDFESDEFTVEKAIHPGEEENDLKTMIVTFKEKLPEHIDSKLNGEGLFVAENTTYTPSVSIINNVFEEIPTRGVLTSTGKEVVIKGNKFINMTMDSIFISNDSQDWYESGPVNNMHITENTFYVAKGGYDGLPNAAIRVQPITLPNENLNNGKNEFVHKNIVIDNNIFYMEHPFLLSIENVSNLKFVNNQIFPYNIEVKSKNNPNTEMFGTFEDWDNLLTYNIIESNDVVIEKNIVDPDFIVVD